MINSKEKIVLSYQEQIDHFKSRGVIFGPEFDEKRAKEYLKSHNVFFRLKAYCFDFEDLKSDTCGRLNFSDLVDLARIDDRLRKLIMYLSIDIEHFSKVQLLGLITKKCTDRDAYEIVGDYESWSVDNQRIKGRSPKKINDIVGPNSHGTYVKELYEKYRIGKNGKNEYRFPVQALLDIMSFGMYVNFYEFCVTELIDNLSEKWTEILYLLRKIKDARNGAVHDNCFINDLKVKNADYEPDRHMVEILAQEGVPKPMRQRSLQNEKVLQMITCLYSYRELVVSSSKNYYKFLDRPYTHVPLDLQIEMKFFSDQLEIFITNPPNNLKSIVEQTLKLIKKLVDSWYLS